MVVSNVVELQSYADISEGTQKKVSPAGPLDKFKGVWVSHNGLLATIDLNATSTPSWHQHQYHETFHVDESLTKTSLNVPSLSANAAALSFTRSQFFCADGPKQINKLIRKGCITATINASRQRNTCAMLGETESRHTSLIVGHYSEKLTHSLALVKEFLATAAQKFPVPALEPIQNVVTLNMFHAASLRLEKTTVFDFSLLCPLARMSTVPKKQDLVTNRLLWVSENPHTGRNLCYISTIHDPNSNQLRIYSNKLSLKKHV